MQPANVYEGPSREVDVGHIKGRWRDLGRTAGTVTVGLRRIEVAPGHFSTPAHEHGGDEEIFYVLAGDGLLWLDEKTYMVGAGDCIVHRPKTGAHTLRAGDSGLDVLVFGQRRDAALTALPRAGAAWSWPRWVLLGEGDPPFRREAQAGPPECTSAEGERPQNVVALSDVELIFDGRARRLGKAAGAHATGLNYVTLAPGVDGAPPHCHSLEEEVFVVLEGSGTLELWGRGAEAPDEQPLELGDVVSRPAGTGVSHAIKPGAEGIVYLAYGTHENGDMCFYPQSGSVSLRGLGIALISPQIEVRPAL